MIGSDAKLEPPRTETPELELLTLRDVATAMSVCYLTALRWATAGRLPGAFKRGRCWRVRRAVFKAWVDRGCPAR